MSGTMAQVREYNFDGLVGPTHNCAGLARGNRSITPRAGDVASPKAAALQGLEKMRLVMRLGVGQAVLPPLARPDLGALRRVGFRGTDAQVVQQANEGDGHWLRLCSSASSMWTANAATVVPSRDTTDGKVHLTVANLSATFHRSLEAPGTLAVLRRVFEDPLHFTVHEPLPGGEHLADEGGANHLRLATPTATVHLFTWGRSAFEPGQGPEFLARRQTREASLAVARLCALPGGLIVPWQQDGHGIEAGAFHTDVLAAGNEAFLMMHEHALAHHRDAVRELGNRLGEGLSCVVADETELPVRDAVGSYPFNSQVVTLPDGTMAIIAPLEARESESARRFLERVAAADNPVGSVHYVDVNASMNNGGGPACLRLRVPLTQIEQRAIGPRVFLDDTLDRALVAWVERHYRDRMTAEDLADPKLLVEVHTALDELTEILAMGPVYDFQRT
jgi:succinylarginine dihydrolase